MANGDADSNLFAITRKLTEKFRPRHNLSDQAHVAEIGTEIDPLEAKRQFLQDIEKFGQSLEEEGY